MQVVRAFPVKSKEAVVAFARNIEKWSDSDKEVFRRNLRGGHEDWYFQTIDGKPYVLSVFEGPQVEESFKWFATANDPFTVWFKSEVKKITDIDLDRLPKGPPTELLYHVQGA
jgi:hypothetical protein